MNTPVAAIPSRKNSAAAGVSNKASRSGLLAKRPTSPVAVVGPFAESVRSRPAAWPLTRPLGLRAFNGYQVTVTATVALATGLRHKSAMFIVASCTGINR
jgi:hypothetical protein